MIIASRVGDAKAQRHHIQKRWLALRDALLVKIGSHVKVQLIGAGLHFFCAQQQTVIAAVCIRDTAFDDGTFAGRSAIKPKAHAGGGYTGGGVEYVRAEFCHSFFRYAYVIHSITPFIMTPAALNALDHPAFTNYLAAIYEHSPWIPERTWQHRPFASRAELHQALARTLDAATDAEKLALIKAHPELAGKAALRGELTDDSKREQAGAGLDQCSAEEFALIQRVNREYGDKFGFPFIIAVKGLKRADIIAAMQRRLGNDRATEFAEALAQIKHIAAFRLSEKISD